MFGCQTNNLVEGLKNDYAPETKAVVFNKYEELIKNNIPLNGMIMVKENETILALQINIMLFQKILLKIITFQSPTI